MTDERKEWEKLKSSYKKSHTPQCKRCGYFAPWGSGAWMQIHHIKPLSEGGSNEESNLIVLCEYCHYEWHHIAKKEKREWKDFLSECPLHVIGAAMGAHDKFGMPISLDDLRKGWPWLQDAIRTRQPYKNDKCKEYTEKNCGNWIDW